MKLVKTDHWNEDERAYKVEVMGEDGLYEVLGKVSSWTMTSYNRGIQNGGRKELSRGYKYWEAETSDYQQLGRYFHSRRQAVQAILDSKGVNVNA